MFTTITEHWHKRNINYCNDAVTDLVAEQAVELWKQCTRVLIQVLYTSTSSAAAVAITNWYQHLTSLTTYYCMAKQNLCTLSIRAFHCKSDNNYIKCDPAVYLRINSGGQISLFDPTLKRGVLRMNGWMDGWIDGWMNDPVLLQFMSWGRVKTDLWFLCHESLWKIAITVPDRFTSISSMRQRVYRRKQ